MMTILRIVLTAALAYGLYAARENAAIHPDTGDLMNAFWLGYCIIVGIFAAIAWAPLIAGRMAESMTGALTDGAFIEDRNRLMRCVRWLDGRGQRFLVRWLCFLEGVRHPWLPAQFLTGMSNSRPGSWLEWIFAREVYRFNNTRYCVRAFEVLKRHGITPPLHENNEINLVLLSLEREARPELPPVPVLPAAAPPPIQRDRRIKLFSAAEPRAAAAAERPVAQPVDGPRFEPPAPLARRPRTPFGAADSPDAGGQPDDGG